MRKSNKANSENLCKQANALLKEKNFKSALVQFNQALEINPNCEEATNGKFCALSSLASAAHEMRDYTLALKYFERAHDAKPSDMDIVDQLASLRHSLYRKKRPETEFTVPNTPHDIDRLIMAGAGIKGLGYTGALEILFTTYVDRRKLIAVGGASAGGLSGLPIAFGYTLQEMKDELQQLQFTDLMQGEFREKFLYLLKNKKNVENMAKGFGADFKRVKNFKKHSSEAISASSNIAKNASSPDFKLISEGLSLLAKDNFGLFSGFYLRERVFERLIQQKTGIAYCTFRELHELHLKDPEIYKDLYVVGTNVSRQQIQVFSYETTPDDIISDAEFITSCFPGFFIYHCRHIKVQGERIKLNNDIFIDGGALDNYPLWLFDREKYLPYGSPNSNKIIQNPHVLGIRVASAQKIHEYTSDDSLPPLDQPKDIINYFFQIFLAVRNKEESDHIKNFESKRTIYINNLGIPTTQFDLDPRKQMALIKNGRVAVSEQFPTLEYKKREAHKPADIWSSIKSGNSEEIEKWLHFGFQLDTRDSDGNTVLDVAYKEKNIPIMLFLVLHGALLTTYPTEIVDILSDLLNNIAIDTRRLEKSLEQFKAHHKLNVDVEANRNIILG